MTSSQYNTVMMFALSRRIKISEVGVSAQDMQWCQEYAFQNRRHMLDLMVDVVEQVGKSSPDMEQSVNIHHNFCQCERCTYTVSSIADSCPVYAYAFIISSSPSMQLISAIQVQRFMACAHHKDGLGQPSICDSARACQ